MLGLKLNHVSKRGHWRYQAITWTDIDLQPTISCGIYMGEISLEICAIPTTKSCSKITHKMRATSYRDQCVKAYKSR